MSFTDRRDRNKSKLSDHIRGKSAGELLEEISKEFGNRSGSSMFFDNSDTRTSPQRVCSSVSRSTYLHICRLIELSKYQYVSKHF